MTAGGRFYGTGRRQTAFFLGSAAMKRLVEGKSLFFLFFEMNAAA
ncbi:hypothetical protein SAMN05428963_11544 [Consotaella salsifontis]|uniref:Uncharacterized protein n=1 Tax=Consotaella salsifontis TaxID=1365950 RepID=A0A1T4SWU5_9HYPH|nr:hypothetical protein SAMN05428963_11544 [Consotaella salsifontis]